MDDEWEPGVPLYQNPWDLWMDELNTGVERTAQFRRQIFEVLRDHSERDCLFCAGEVSGTDKAMVVTFEKEAA